MISFGAPISVNALATTKAFRPGERVERDHRHVLLVDLLDVHAAHVRERHRRRAEMRESLIEKYTSCLAARRPRT
jgi:hypothetical protein